MKKDRSLRARLGKLEEAAPPEVRGEWLTIEEWKRAEDELPDGTPEEQWRYCRPGQEPSDKLMEWFAVVEERRRQVEETLAMFGESWDDDDEGAESAE